MLLGLLAPKALVSELGGMEGILLQYYNVTGDFELVGVNPEGGM